MSLRISVSAESKSCRLCLRQTETYINIFEGNFQQMIIELTTLEISTDDSYSKNACINCIDEVQQAVKTKRRIVECQRKLQEIKNLKVENSQHAEWNYAEIVTIDEYSGDVDEVCNNTPNSELVEISGYDDYSEEDTLHDFDVKSELISDSYDMSYDYTDSDEVNNHELVKDEEGSKSNKSTLQSQGFDKSVMKSMKEEFPVEKKERMRSNKKCMIRKKFECVECNLDFQTDNYAHYLHMLKHKKSQCKVCGITIRSDNMGKHLKCHTGGPRICDLCGTTCKNIESLRGHIFYMHRKKADEYKCDLCDRSFRMKYKLDQHKTKEHIGVRNHICETCKKAFFTVRDMNSHIKMTHLKLRPHICPHCERGFSSKYALKTHVRQHTNETPYKCFVCAEGFRQNVSLRTHLKSKHKISEAKNFACEFCDKAFHTEFALKVHLRLHGDDNYKCKHCEECFQQKIFLVNHLKTVHNMNENLIFVSDIESERTDDPSQMST